MWILFSIFLYQFTSKEYDEETGLYYMSARYQNPVNSRWVSSDPAGWALVNPNRSGFNIVEAQNPYSYTGNNPINFSDPSGLETETEAYYKEEFQKVLDAAAQTKIDYFDGLDQNYMPEDEWGADIGDISKYIMSDGDGNPITDENGAARFNELGKEVLGGDNGWRIEAADTYHEKDGNSPVVKLVHTGGGEQIYDMFSGDLVTDPEFAGTFNVFAGPYPFLGKEFRGHKKFDVDTWLLYGGVRGDPTTFADRKAKIGASLTNSYGSAYRNCPNNLAATILNNTFNK